MPFMWTGLHSIRNQTNLRYLKSKYTRCRITHLRVVLTHRWNCDYPRLFLFLYVMPINLRLIYEVTVPRHHSSFHKYTRAPIFKMAVSASRPQSAWYNRNHGTRLLTIWARPWIELLGPCFSNTLAKKCTWRSKNLVKQMNSSLFIAQRRIVSIFMETEVFEARDPRQGRRKSSFRR